jgi:hypothetical protein
LGRSRTSEKFLRNLSLSVLSKAGGESYLWNLGKFWAFSPL